MQEIAYSFFDNPIPRFRGLRRVPLCYRHVLPLRVVERYQCLVVGAAGGMLTVAITDEHDTSVLESLSRLTRHTIFPVRVDSARMHLLIRRIERREHRRGNVLRHSSIRYQFQVRSLVMLLR